MPTLKPGCWIARPDDLGVVGGEGVAAAVLEGLVGVGVLVVLLELDLGVVGLEVGFGGRALGDDEGLAGQLAHVVISAEVGETTPRETLK